MKRESFWWLAGLVAAHPGRKLVGRTRLQKEVKLLQRKGFPTDYSYSIHFYGLYSEDVNSDLRLVRQFKLVKEELKDGNNANPYYIYTASPEADLAEIEPFQPVIDLLVKTGEVPLELAATYDSYRELGCDHAEALKRLRRKKGSKCDGGNLEAALALLRQLELPVE